MFRCFHSWYDYLGEGAAQFHVRCCRELSLRAHVERAGIQAVQVGHDQEQVRRSLDRQEAAAGNVYSQGIVEAFDGRTHRSLQLDDVLPTVERLMNRRGERPRYMFF